MILEKDLISAAASSKNAGFTCFGSPTELLDDLKNTDEELVWQNFKDRYDGLQKLFNWLNPRHLCHSRLGSWDLIQDPKITDEVRGKMDYLNTQAEQAIGIKDVFSEDEDSMKRFRFKNVQTSFRNRMEGQLDTSALFSMMEESLEEKCIDKLRGIHVSSFQTQQDEVILQTNVGEFRTEQLLIASNGFAKDLLPEEDVAPARAQVLITCPIKKLKPQGTFHLDRGYYYFRNIDDRLLLGGGRQLDIQEETTTSMEQTAKIQNALEHLLKTTILPDTPFEVEHRWSGIMGVGANKKPIVKRINDRVICAVRMGGMGVALGTAVGQKAANLF